MIWLSFNKFIWEFDSTSWAWLQKFVSVWKINFKLWYVLSVIKWLLGSFEHITMGLVIKPYCWIRTPSIYKCFMSKVIFLNDIRNPLHKRESDHRKGAGTLHVPMVLLYTYFVGQNPCTNQVMSVKKRIWMTFWNRDLTDRYEANDYCTMKGIQFVCIVLYYDYMNFFEQIFTISKCFRQTFWNQCREDSAKMTFVKYNLQ